MWEDKFRKIERSKPNKPPSPPRRQRKRPILRALGLSRKHTKRSRVLGFAAFFLLGTLVGVLFGPSTSPISPPSESRKSPSPAATSTGSHATDGPKSPVRLKAYVYRSPERATEEAATTDHPRKTPPSPSKPHPEARPVTPPAPVDTQPESGGEADTSIVGGKAARALPQWLAYAMPEPVDAVGPRIALVIDDLGIDQARTKRAIALPGPVTMAFLPYGYHLGELTTAARAGGHELLVHLPMQPQDDDANPGPNALLRTLTPSELRERIAWNLSRFDGFVGINNHMGSGFTRWNPGVTVLMEEIRRRGLLFLDSLTSRDSVAGRVATRFDVPFAVRDVFLDNEQDTVEIRKQLDRLEEIARKRGYAVGIGHPHDTTLEVLEVWLANAKARGLSIVPLSAIVKQRHVAG